MTFFPRLVSLTSSGFVVATLLTACAGNRGTLLSEKQTPSTSDPSSGQGDTGVEPKTEPTLGPVLNVPSVTTPSLTELQSTDAGLDGTDSSTRNVVEVEVGSAGGGTGFLPAEVTIHVGDTVRWKWIDGKHNVVSGSNGLADGKFCNPLNDACDDAPLKKPPYQYEVTFSNAGDFPYFCSPHVPMGMKGTIHVVP